MCVYLNNNESNRVKCIIKLDNFGILLVLKFKCWTTNM